ncbi:hypothetical protein QF024_000368 [Chryseobacterium nepalense]|nr:hypothetical protein [Chryseobacterium nepalense]
MKPGQSVGADAVTQLLPVPAFIAKLQLGRDGVVKPSKSRVYGTEVTAEHNVVKFLSVQLKELEVEE